MPISGVLSNSFGWASCFYFYGKWDAFKSFKIANSNSNTQRFNFKLQISNDEIAIVNLFSNFLTFLFLGIAGIIWYIAWLWLSFEKPCKHPTISQEELIYIEESIGNVADNVITVSLASSG